jgi:hypothetical protein
MNPLLVVDKYNHLVPNFRFCYNLLDVIVNIVLLLDDFARENALLVSLLPETQNSLIVLPTPILTSFQNLTCTMTLLNDLLASVFFLSVLDYEVSPQSDYHIGSIGSGAEM